LVHLFSACPLRAFAAKTKKNVKMPKLVRMFLDAGVTIAPIFSSKSEALD